MKEIMKGIKLTRKIYRKLVLLKMHASGKFHARKHAQAKSNFNFFFLPAQNYVIGKGKNEFLLKKIVRNIRDTRFLTSFYITFIIAFVKFQIFMH